jgi:ribosomal protein S8
LDIDTLRKIKNSTMKKHTTTPQQDSGMMTVSIPRIEQHEGYPGNIITIEISNKCPICGGKRGEPHKVLSYDGSRRLEVDGWQNPCGHIDKYESVRQEYLNNNPDINDPDFDPTRKDYKPEEPAKEVLQDKHTPGEWIVDERNGQICIEAIGKDGEETTAVEVCIMHGNEKIDKDDAEFICKAVNNYQSLVDALKECDSILTKCQYWIEGSKSIQQDISLMKLKIKNLQNETNNS